MARKMKDSGMEWIGEIPEEWEITKLKNCMTFINGYAFDSKDLHTEGIYSVIRIGDISDGKVNFDRANKILESNKTLDKYKIQKNDILLAMSGATVGKAGYIETVEGDSYINQRVGIMRGNNSKYIYYCINTDGFIRYILLLSAGSAQPNISTENVNNFYVPIIPPEEQGKIVEYLDAQCAHIDAVIEQTKASIEEYRKLKQAVITQAVTKGICDERPMKDSGIEWIGEIPQEWDVIKFGKCVSIKSNLVNPEEYMEYWQIAPDNIEKGSARLLDNVKTVAETGVISWNHLFFKGQIIYSKIRPLLNKVIIAPYDGLCSADMYPMETGYNTKYVVYLMLSSMFTAQVGLVTANRVKMPKINQNELNNILVALPSLEEQKEIVDYLDKQCTAIDTLISKKEQFLNELENYKKSLIYEYVTGKKEVP